MFKKIFLVSSLLITSMTAHAGFISGTHTTSGGKTVNLQGLEWMPLAYTLGLSRNQVEDASGFTDRFNGKWKNGDWRYATRAETSLLLMSLHGGDDASQSFFDELNADGAKWFTKQFGTTYHSDWWDYTYFNYGEREQCSYTYEHKGCLQGIVHYQNFQKKGMFSFQEGLSATADENLLVRWHPDFANSVTASLLVRPSSVPSTPVSAPSALSIFAFGLCGLLLRRRKIAA